MNHKTNTPLSNHRRDSFLNQSILAWARDHHTTVEFFSDDWIKKLTRDDTAKYIYGADFGLNTSTATKITQDKAALYTILTADNILTLPHHLLLRPNTWGAPEDIREQALAWFAQWNKTVVLKPNEGSNGIDIYFINNEEEFLSTLEVLWQKYRALSISPWVNIENEWRVSFLVDNTPLLYEKIRPVGEIRHNLAFGAQAQIVTGSRLRNELSSLAKQAGHATQITFANIDIIEVEGQKQILEINNGVFFEKFSAQNEQYYLQAQAIYFDALNQLFNL